MKLFKPPGFVKLIYNRRIWGFSLREQFVYLTFDDGPHPDITPWVLDELQKNKLKATFFCVGENVQRYPEIFERIKAEGHAVGNHTMRHENAGKTKTQLYMQSIEEADHLIQSPLFRPPYGRLAPNQARTIAKRFQIVMWSWLSYDFDKSVSVADILQKADKQIQKGDVLVLHDNPKIAERQRELLPQLLHLLQQKGFQFAKIS